jgi:hypothetical protein
MAEFTITILFLGGPGENSGMSIVSILTTHTLVLQYMNSFRTIAD